MTTVIQPDAAMNELSTGGEPENRPSGKKWDTAEQCSTLECQSAEQSHPAIGMTNMNLS
jgi:hypothetical protein